MIFYLLLKKLKQCAFFVAFEVHPPVLKYYFVYYEQKHEICCTMSARRGAAIAIQEDVPQNLQKKHIALIFLIRDKKSNPVNTLLNY